MKYVILKSQSRTGSGSPSTRREWIEIFSPRTHYLHTYVSLHTEGVD